MSAIPPSPPSRMTENLEPVGSKQQGLDPAIKGILRKSDQQRPAAKKSVLLSQTKTVRMLDPKDETFRDFQMDRKLGFKSEIDGIYKVHLGFLLFDHINPEDSQTSNLTRFL